MSGRAETTVTIGNMTFEQAIVTAAGLLEGAGKITVTISERIHIHERPLRQV